MSTSQETRSRTWVAQGTAVGTAQVSPAGIDRPASSRRSFGQVLASSQPTGWDPREVWLTRVHKPREGALRRITGPRWR